MVESPISAGVDGTQSASGVHTSIPDSGVWSSMLYPTPTTRASSASPASASSGTDEDEWYTVTLDGRTLRTPLGLPLSLPTATLALGIASEWDAQGTHLRPAQMPLMTLCCTAIDQVAPSPQVHRLDVLRYLSNDTTCYWADPADDDGKERALHRRQCTLWDGLHDSVSTAVLGLLPPTTAAAGATVDEGVVVRPARAMGEGEALLLSRKSESNPFSGLPHPPLLTKRAEQWVMSLDAWTLAALYSACVESKSFFVGAALIHNAMGGAAATAAALAIEGGAKDSNVVVRDVTWAVGAARVEEEFNIECWGLVEGGHDYDRLNCSIQMHAASFLARTVANR